MALFVTEDFAVQNKRCGEHHSGRPHAAGRFGRRRVLQRRTLRARGIDSEHALIVVHVESGSTAHTAGLMDGDNVVAFDGRPVHGVDDLHRVLTEARIGVGTVLTILRRGVKRDLEVTPIESPRRS